VYPYTKVSIPVEGYLIMGGYAIYLILYFSGTVLVYMGNCGTDSKATRMRLVHACNIWIFCLVIMAIIGFVIAVSVKNAAGTGFGIIAEVVLYIAMVMWWRCSAKEYAEAFDKQANQNFNQGYNNTQQFI